MLPPESKGNNQNLLDRFAHIYQPSRSSKRLDEVSVAIEDEAKDSDSHDEARLRVAQQVATRNDGHSVAILVRRLVKYTSDAECHRIRSLIEIRNNGALLRRGNYCSIAREIDYGGFAAHRHIDGEGTHAGAENISRKIHRKARWFWRRSARKRILSANETPSS